VELPEVSELTETLAAIQTLVAEKENTAKRGRAEDKPGTPQHCQ